MEEKCCEAVWAWLFYTFFLPRRILGTSTSATSSAPAVEQIDLELPDPSLSWVSTSARRLKGAEINKGSPTRPPALGSVGGRCNDHQHQGVVDELFSSEVNLRNYMEVGWRRVYCLEECCKAGCVWLRRGRLQHLLLLGEDLQAVIKSTAAASASVAQCCRSIVLC